MRIATRTTRGTSCGGIAQALTSVARDSVGVVSATIHAVHVGRATIQVIGTDICKPGVACPQFALLWTLKVDVTNTL